MPDGVQQVIQEYGWAKIIGVCLIALFLLYCIVGPKKSTSSTSSPVSQPAPTDNSDGSSGTGGE